MAKVSIIILVYNVETYLERCLRSVVKRAISDAEILCIDDESTKHSLKVLKE